jgi:hypothetical protein
LKGDDPRKRRLDGSAQVTPKRHRKREYVRATQNIVIYGFPGAAVLLAILLLYLVLAHQGQMTLPPARWILFGGLALALVLASFLPSLVRRWRGLPPSQPLWPTDISLVITVTLAGCALAFLGVFFEMWWLMAFGIMLPPLSFIWRNAQKQMHDWGTYWKGSPGSKTPVNEIGENVDQINQMGVQSFLATQAREQTPIVSIKT